MGRGGQEGSVSSLRLILIRSVHEGTPEMLLPSPDQPSGK